MLVDFESGGKLVKSVPFQRDFRHWKSNMTAVQIADVKTWIHHQLDMGDVHTTSWMPGSDWRGTPLQAIYSSGTKRSEVAAAKCFGLFVWDCVLERIEESRGFKALREGRLPHKGSDLFSVGRTSEEDVTRSEVWTWDGTQAFAAES